MKLSKRDGGLCGSDFVFNSILTPSAFSSLSGRFPKDTEIIFYGSIVGHCLLHCLPHLLPSGMSANALTFIIIIIILVFDRLV